MKRLLNSLSQLLLVLVLGVSLSGCVTTHVPTASTSPWQAEDLDTQANPLDVAFTDSRHGYLVGSCLLYTSPSPRDLSTSRMPSSA